MLRDDKGKKKINDDTNIVTIWDLMQKLYMEFKPLWVKGIKLSRLSRVGIRALKIFGSARRL